MLYPDELTDLNHKIAYHMHMLSSILVNKRDGIPTFYIQVLFMYHLNIVIKI